MEQLLALIPADIVAYIGVAVSIIAALMTVLPKPESETSVYGYIYKVLNFIAFNFGKASNK